jgi:hypothetical protein
VQILRLSKTELLKKGLCFTYKTCVIIKYYIIVGFMYLLTQYIKEAFFGKIVGLGLEPLYAT